MQKTPIKTIRCTKHGIKIFYERSEQVVSVYYEEKGLSDIQLHGNTLNGVSYQSVGSSVFNTLQNKLYKRLIYGIEAMTKTELVELSITEIRQINRDHRKAIKVLNAWKNQVVSSYVDRLFAEVFWNSDVAKEMVNFSKEEDYEDQENTLSFKELGLSKKQVAVKLIEHGLLPVNFFQMAA
jgi:hypothetical protein